MGYYIQTDDVKNKAQYIVDNYGGTIIDDKDALVAVSQGMGVICVVDNGPFEAAAFCYNLPEALEFARPDGRQKTWVVMDKAKAAELSNCPPERFENTN